MRLDVEVKLNLNTEELKKAVAEASRLAMRDTVVAVAGDAIDMSPVLTGNNRRSIKYEVSGMGQNEMVDPEKTEGAVYSTSGYGGYLETGTYKMPARPYFRPALNRNFSAEKFAAKVKEHLK